MNNHEIRRSVGPVIEPVTLAELQEHVIGPSTDASLLTSLIKVARELFELHTGIAIIEQTWVLSLPRFAREIRLPRPPLRSISSIQYYDTSAALQTLSTAVYRVSAHGVLMEAASQTYPATETERPDAVQVTFTAGIYTNTGASPDAVDTAVGGGSPDNGNPNHMTAKYPLAQQAIKIMAVHLYENRGIVAPVQLTECPMSYQAIVNACRVQWA